MVLLLLLLSKLVCGADLQDLQSLQATAWMAEPSAAWLLREQGHQ